MALGASPATSERRNARDRRTLAALFGIYCRAHHAPAARDAGAVRGDATGRDAGAAAGRDAGALCAECAEAMETALERTRNCPHGHKHNCQDCTTKCSGGQQRERVRAIMRYAAPRMAFRHPIMTMEYLAKKLR